MICPYNRKSLTYIKQCTKDLVSEETGVWKSDQEIIKEEYVMMECIKENCGAWYDGRCNYYTTIKEEQK